MKILGFLQLVSTPGFWLGAVILFGVAGCQPERPYYYSNGSQVSNLVTQEQAWQHEKDNAGFSGSFNCPTASGGCLHMSCATEKSCAFMLDAEKRCTAKPDPKVTEKCEAAAYNGGLTLSNVSISGPLRIDNGLEVKTMTGGEK